eukprot:TRINITY_DN3308_c0_g1_i1.p1 TRINITY_DN3308_c0_g1~~TRINITY_DN3308_c0_g1_i1.p1  ORF type:complete len:463 (-),score=135.63 TRINITY_DN3308_c0_g1_i1:112-1500(-)
MIKNKFIINSTKKYLINNLNNKYNILQNKSITSTKLNGKINKLYVPLTFRKIGYNLYSTTKKEEIEIIEAENIEVIEGELPVPDNPLELMRNTRPENNPKDVAVKSPRTRKDKIGQRILRASLADYNNEWDPESAEKAIQESIVKNDVQPDPKSWAYLLQACARKGDLKRLDKVLGDMKQTNVKGHPMMMNYLILTFGERGQIDLVEKYVDQFTKGYFNLELNGYSYRNLIFAYKVVGNAEKAENLLIEMMRKNFLPEVETFCDLFDVFEKSGNYQRAFDYFQHMIDIEYRLAQGIYFKLMEIAVRAKDEQRVLFLFKHIEKHRIGVNIGYPNVPAYIYSLIIELYASLGNLEKAEEWYNRMRKAKKRPIVRTYKSLLKALLTAGQHSEVFELFKFSVYKGQVDKEMLDMVVEQCKDPEQVKLCQDLVSGLKGWHQFGDIPLEMEKPPREFGFVPRTKQGVR